MQDKSILGEKFRRINNEEKSEVAEELGVLNRKLLKMRRLTVESLILGV